MSDNLIDDIAADLGAKENSKCCAYKLDCSNESHYNVTMIYGVRDVDRQTIPVCVDHLAEIEKECRDWGYGIVKELLPGKTIVAKPKRKGRPKNL